MSTLSLLTSKVLLLSLIAGMASGCPGQSTHFDKNVGGLDLGDASAAEEDMDLDTEGDMDLGAEEDVDLGVEGDVDLGGPDEATAHCGALEVEFVDGTGGRRQFVHTYDHRFWWWENEDRTTVGFFHPAGFAEFPHDRSLEFRDLREIQSAVEVPLLPGEQCYGQWVVDRGLTMRRSPLDGQAQILMGNEGYHRHEDGYGDFAWDFTRIDDTGARFLGDGAAVEDYFVWGADVYSPVSGVVVEIYRDGEDHAPGAHPEGAQNNLVGIHLSGGYHLYVLHFRQGSIPPHLNVGDHVSVGDYLGEVGNSGVTLEPHLHVTLLWWDGDRYWSVPTVFDELLVGDFPSGPMRPVEEVVPQTGQIVADPM